MKIKNSKQLNIPRLKFVGCEIEQSVYEKVKERAKSQNRSISGLLREVLKQEGF